MIEQQACPLCKKKFNQLHSHLRNKHRLSARERRPYMKIARSAVKHKDTVLNKTDIIVTEFGEQKSTAILHWMCNLLEIRFSHGFQDRLTASCIWSVNPRVENTITISC